MHLPRPSQHARAVASEAFHPSGRLEQVRHRPSNLVLGPGQGFRHGDGNPLRLGERRRRRGLLVLLFPQRVVRCQRLALDVERGALEDDLFVARRVRHEGLWLLLFVADMRMDV